MIKDDSYCLACKSVLHQKEFFHDINSLTCGPSQSRAEEASSGEEMSAIFSITTDINDISAQVLDRDFLLVLNVNQFLSRDQSCEESGFNF